MKKIELRGKRVLLVGGGGGHEFSPTDYEVVVGCNWWPITLRLLCDVVYCNSEGIRREMELVFGVRTEVLRAPQEVVAALETYGTTPFIGTVALFHILGQRPAELAVTGFNLYEGNEKLPHSERVKQKEMLRTVWEDENLVIDSVLKRILSEGD